MQNISKSFFGVRVLFDVNFSVRRGEVHALLGENGAGKSTLTKILSAVYRKESGEIILDGKPLHADSPRVAMDAGVSVIFQEFNLNPHATIPDDGAAAGKRYQGWFMLENYYSQSPLCGEDGDFCTPLREDIAIVQRWLETH